MARRVGRAGGAAEKARQSGTGSAAQRARPGVSQEPAEAAALAEMVGAVLDDIAGSGAGDPGRRRLFFPDGVQLLRAKLSLGPGGGAELEIAGPSGSPAGVASAAVAAPEPHGHARLESKTAEDEPAPAEPDELCGSDTMEGPAAERGLAVAAAARERSGRSWVARFPGSRSLTYLKAGFRQAAEAFIGSMKDAGATVRISATFRPPERAYLMHFAWAIARLGANPSTVPPMAGVDIEWDHGNASASRSAAEEMVLGYGLSVQAALNSRHTERRAVDMSISWSGTLSLRNGSGGTTNIATTPRSGQNAQLHTVGRSFGVFKLVSDPPHWSDDGH
jgi:hypothetical protein